MEIGIDAIREAVQDGHEAAGAFLEEMIRIPSVAGTEQAVQRLIAERFAQLDVRVEACAVPDDLVDDPEYSGRDARPSYAGRENLVITRAGKGGGRSLLLNTHSDVVAPGEWAEAFSPRREGDVIFGRGAADAKGCVATMWLANRALDALKVKTLGEVVNTVVIEEEIGGNGTLALVRQGVTAEAVVVLEITDLAFCIANRGAVWFLLEVEGKPTHMARITEGVSALDEALEAIEIWQAYEQELIERAKSQPLFAQYERPAQLNVGMISAGSWPSMVPAHCRVEGGVGFLPDTSLDEVKREMVRRIEQRGSRWLREHYRLTFNRLHNDAFQTPADAAVVRSMSASLGRAGLDGTPTGWISSCDARTWSKIAGLPTVVFGPGKLEHAHSDGEHVDLNDVARAAEALVMTAIDWCGA